MLIHPQRLRQLRESKGLTRQKLAELAELSERQIARIESSENPVNAHRNTRDSLAKVLEVDIEQLSGRSSPILETQSATQAPRIHGATLRLLRRFRHLSVGELAQKSKVSKRHIGRLEAKAGASSVRAVTLKRLAASLEVETSKLCAPADRPRLNHDLPRAIPVNVEIPPQVALAYDLVSARYGATMVEILCLAPMLFTLLAEASLAWRRTGVERIAELVEEFNEACAPKDYVLYGANQEESWEGIWYELESIEQRDLIGKQRRGYIHDLNRDSSDTDRNPFLAYLRHLAQEVDAHGVVDLSKAKAESGFHLFPGWRAFQGGYEICARELARITGGSNEALLALQYGDVRLRDVPEALGSDETAEQRIAWLEERLSDEVKEGMRDFKNLADWLEVRKGPRHAATRNKKAANRVSRA